MSDLASRLLAAIEESERNAEAMKRMRVMFQQARRVGHTVMEEFFTRHSPAAVLRRCAADKALLDLHGPNDGAGDCQECFSWVITGQYTPKPFPCPTVLLLAQGYGISVEEETTGE